ncbi:MAG: D-alanyl-D-alanine carboxypeptidase [Flavobacteriaceae bacterium]|nr:D-alanyl-D-alanine carboxypeptidase [Flavobacteriaceae bacterium]
MFKKIILLFLTIIVTSCSTAYNIKKKLKREHIENTFFKGFVLYNPATKKELINHNGNKYFTPASNTKLYTFYTAYRILGDSIKGLEYYKTKDSLIIKGAANSSLLYGFDDSKVLNFLKKAITPIYLIDAHIDDTKYGNGWAWDDYQYYYMPEKSLFPTHSNMLTYIVKNDSISSEISALKDNIYLSDGPLRREISENKFYAKRGKNKKYEVPFVTSNELTAKILSNKIDKKITLIPNRKYDFKPLYSEKKDSLLIKLLVDSDNFIAEQLMLQVGKEVSDKYNVKEAIEYSLENYLSNLPQTPRWVDGSGLSRYNLFTPSDMVYLLEKMYREISQEKLFTYFPVGGKSGTLKKWYGNEKPYIFAKTGSLSNNYNLSGYLVTKKGTVLIFSYMNNHFKESSSEIKKTMEITLKEIYNKY